jgi:Glycosyl hydrolases family 25
MPRIGPDISHHQEEKNVDLARAKPHVDFVFLKATEGTTVVDETFKIRWQKLAQLGIPRGAYHFARPGDAAAQAAHFVKVVKTQNGFRAGDVAIIDVENTKKEPHLWDGTTPTALRAFIDRFVKDVRQDLPVETVVLYTGIPFWNKNFGHPPKLPANCVGWLSRYRKAGPYGGNFPRPAAWPDPPDIWQFTDGIPGEGKPKPRDIPGIGTVDTSEMTEACFQRLFEEEDDFTGLFDNVNQFRAAVGAVVKDEVGKAVQEELKDFYALLARGGDPVPGPTDQHFKDSHRGLDTRLTDIYKLLARGEIDGEINPTGTQFRDSNRHLAKLLEDIAARLPESTPRP